MGKTPEELYREREKRINEAIQLKVPDRVPIAIVFNYFPAKYAGITIEEAFYDYNKWKMACKKTVVDFEPDMYRVAYIIPGTVLEILDCKQIKWPGHGIAPNHPHQFVEAEYMKADEYDLFLKDPSDYVIRVYLPRVYGSLDSFKMLPPLRSILFGGYGRTDLTSVFTMPEFASAFEALNKAGSEVLNWHSGMSSFDKEMAEQGFPNIFVVSVPPVPFDQISDYLRGMRGTMFDMYRQPDKLVEACEKLLPMIIEEGVSSARRNKTSKIFVPLHRGSDGFLSPKQFETFYWPTLKRLTLSFVENGLIPCLFFEGDYTSRLEHLLELPKAKVIAYFDQTDMFKAKEILGNHFCIRGNVPASLLQAGKPQDVKDYCKKLIDVVGKGGGFIMSPGSSLDQANPENIKTMIDFTKEYGVYS